MLEISWREPDINLGMIRDADQWIRKAYIRRNKTMVVYRTANISCYIWFDNRLFIWFSANYNPRLYWSRFIICLIITVASAIVVLVITKRVNMKTNISIKNTPAAKVRFINSVDAYREALLQNANQTARKDTNGNVLEISLQDIEIALTAIK